MEMKNRQYSVSRFLAEGFFLPQELALGSKEC